MTRWNKDWADFFFFGILRHPHQPNQNISFKPPFTCVRCNYHQSLLPFQLAINFLLFFNVIHPDAPQYLCKICWFKVGKMNPFNLLFLSCALALAKSLSQARQWMKNDCKSDTTVFESHPCWLGKTLHARRTHVKIITLVCWMLTTFVGNLHIQHVSVV